MNPFKHISFLLLVNCSIILGQTGINERYVIDETTNSIFTSVFSTDSCYYVAGMYTSSASLNNIKSAWIKFNFDGTIDSLSPIQSDTAGIGFWETNDVIKTLDNNFSCVALFEGDELAKSFIFIKLNIYGDTIKTNVLGHFDDGGTLLGVHPSTLIQNEDSTYFGIVATYRQDDLRGATVFFKLSKDGDLIFYKVFYGNSPTHYRILNPKGMTRFGINKIAISTTLIHTDPYNEEKRHHTKILVVDTLGNLVEELTYFEDTLAYDSYGLTKTVDGGLLYAGRLGRYNVEYNVIGYKAQIAKLDTDFNKEWSIQVGSGYTGSPYIGLRNILAINDSEFVAVGYMKQFSPNDRNQYGWLIKFNINGEKIWERKYLKIPHDHLAPNYPEHQLFDVDTTIDGGFVMVGAGINYENEEELPGQKAWLVKTNPYGCIVPGCQFGDKPADTEPKDTVITQKPPKPEEPKTWVYPNPAAESLFYYHHQDEFNYGTAYIYNSSGQLVQKWEITVNDITYEIDVSGFASGQYVLQVLDGDGVEIEVERFVKI